MRVDQARKDCRLAEVNHLSSRRNVGLCIRSDVDDSLTLKNHDLSRQHLSALAVEQAPGTERYRSWSRRTLKMPPSLPTHGVAPAPRQEAGGTAGPCATGVAAAMNSPNTAVIIGLHRIAVLR